MDSNHAISSCLAAVILVGGLTVMAPEARAQFGSASERALPAGSWRQTCQQAYVRNGVLHAQCRREGGQYVNTTAQVGSCAAFGNRNGALFCESSAGSVGSMAQWSGSFLESCRDAKVGRQGKLQAMCRTSKGTYRRTNLTPQKCPNYRAGNSNGRLVCEADDRERRGSNRDDDRRDERWSDRRDERRDERRNERWNERRDERRDDRRDSGTMGQWVGSFSDSCRNASTDSDGRLTADCQTANGNWRRTSLAARDCNSRRAGNRDGYLVCEG